MEEEEEIAIAMMRMGKNRGCANSRRMRKLDGILIARDEGESITSWHHKRKKGKASHVVALLCCPDSPCSCRL
jgi:hypothetical protein